MDLSVDIGIKLKNPVMGASGTFGYGLEWQDFFDMREIGAIVTKGLSINPKVGNKTPRICETPSGMLNAIGLQNIGIKSFLADKLPRLVEFGTPVIVNFFGNTIDEYGEAAGQLTDDRISALEINISCPNVKEGGIVFGTDPHVASKVVKTVKQNTTLPVIVKLSPNVTDIVLMAKAVCDGGADAISLINTLTGMAIDIKTRKPKLANITGGLSGPAIKPVALRMVWQVANAVDVPVIGIGGITTGEDAIEFIIAGASAIQVGTGNFMNPRCLIDVKTGIENYLKDNKISLTDLRGSLNTAHDREHN